MSEIRLRLISLGAGVQSTTLALMAAHGEIGPMPDAAIFADTGAEPRAVYEHLAWLSSGNVLPFPVHVVRDGNLREEIIAAASGTQRNDGRPPFFIKNPDGSRGVLRRQCTQDYKLRPIQAKVRDLLGLAYRARWPKEPVVEQWIGISLDEIQRCKDAEYAAIKNRWPLIERRMRRHDCLLWLERRGYPEPPKSACTFCPYRNNAAWRQLRDSDPEAWAEAIAVDRSIRTPGYVGLVGEADLHQSLMPLELVDFSTREERGEPGFWSFQQECAGMCGV